MKSSESAAQQKAFLEITEAVCARLAQNQRVRRTLPGRGRVRIDRQLPFLCVYRIPSHADAGTRELVTTEASYLFASADESIQDELNRLCQRINATLQEHFGLFLFIEIWSDPELKPSAEEAGSCRPVFEIVVSEPQSLTTTLTTLKDSLSEIRFSDQNAEVSVRASEIVSPPGIEPLQHVCPETGAAGCLAMGIAVRPIYRDPTTGVLYPMVLQTLRSQLSDALRKTVSQFTGADTTNPLHDYQTLGPTFLVKASQAVDQQLCEVSESFDFLLQVTPINYDQAWSEFQENGFREQPEFFYRPLPYRPSLLKRRLFDIEIERIEDPTLAHLFWEKQEEIDRELTALRDLDRPEFLWSSLQLYGAADDSLVDLAEQILGRTERKTVEPDSNDWLSLETILELAQREIDHYQEQMEEFEAKVEVSDQIASGIMVSHDRLLISRSINLTRQRIAPLLHHEVGTHLLTYFNGRIQPFRQLYAGLAGYDELQEGLAVLAEYLSGGLNTNRLRILAGRVLAVRSMTDGLQFSDTYSRLHEEFQFTPRQSFSTTLRAYRGGGLTKDVIYLRGLRDVLEYLANGHDIEPLYVGKIGLKHLPYIQEMRRRGVINAPAVLPRAWDDPVCLARLEGCRGLSVTQLLEKI